MSKMGSHDPFGHLKYKLWSKERPNLTLNHKKSGIDPMPLCAGEARHAVGKLSTRATTLVKTSS
jgi:hypothetical protein